MNGKSRYRAAMMRKNALRLLRCLTASIATTVLALSLAPAAMAQDDNTAGQSGFPTAGAFERMCSPRGAMQFAWGETGVPGSSKIEGFGTPGFAAPDTLAPFTHAKPRATEWSGRFMEMGYVWPTGDEDAAYELLEYLAIVAEESGWTVAELSIDTAPLYLVGYTGYVTLERPAETPGGVGRVLLSLDYGLGEAVLTCGRDDLLRAHAGEAFGRLPPGTPRPAVPEIAVPLVRNPAECDTPELQAEMAKLIRQRRADSFMGAMVSRTLYRDRLTSWMLWKIGESGKLAPEELVQLSFGAIGEASPGGDPFAALAMFEEMLPIIEAVASAESSGDPAALCRSFVPFHDWLARVDAITLAQTEAVQARLEAEALRLGISLD